MSYLQDLDKANVWFDILRGSRTMSSVDVNVLWEHYYKGLNLNIFNNDQRHKIEKALNVCKFPSKERIQNLNGFFRHDIERLIPISGVIITLEDLIDSRLKDYFLGCPATAELFLENLRWVRSVYFRWQFQRFPDPIDNYHWLSTNINFIRTLLLQDVNVKECPVVGVIIDELTNNLEDFGSCIQRIGEVHGFIDKGHNRDES